MLRASLSDDIEMLKRLAHQLAGSAGSYGFAKITDAARAVERAAEAGADAGSLRGPLEELATLCRRARP
jgi:HPt (histidine-containing phosphotransfer) domain-containing protein